MYTLFMVADVGDQVQESRMYTVHIDKIAVLRSESVRGFRIKAGFTTLKDASAWADKTQDKLNTKADGFQYIQRIEGA